MLWKLFLTFFKIGSFTIGGGYAMLPLIQREVVGKGWIEEDEFIDLFAVAQSLPGTFAINISIFVGYRLQKLRGALVCMVASVLPSFIIILLIALFFTQFAHIEWVEKAFKALRPATVALIAVPCLTTALSLKLKREQLILPALAALLIWQGGVSPVYIILAAALGGIVYSLWLKRK